MNAKLVFHLQNKMDIQFIKCISYLLSVSVYYFIDKLFIYYLGPEKGKINVELGSPFYVQLHDLQDYSKICIAHTGKEWMHAA